MAIDEHKEYKYVFLKGNSDDGGKMASQKIKAYAEQNYCCKFFASLCSQVYMYMSVVENVAALMGNSSSGIVKAPALHLPTINIGDCQKWRFQANSIIPK